MKRGDLVVVALQGDYGKPRPALVVQSDLFNETHASVTVAPVTSTIVDTPLFRVTVEPSRRNGLRSVSQMALLFGRALGQSPQYWLNLQAAHHLKTAEQSIGKRLSAVAEFAHA